MAKAIFISPVGQLGNQMFQYLLARVFQEHAPEAVIYGPAIPQFGIAGREPETAPEPAGRSARLVINRHSFAFERYLRHFVAEENIQLRINSLSLRMRYYRGSLKLAQRVFRDRGEGGKGFGPERLVINIRLGDSLGGIHRNYGPLPIDWYRRLVARTGLDPVFVGQIGDDPYSGALRAAFPGATFIGGGGPMAHFGLLRRSTHVVLSLSTFSWLATWLSESARTIHMPVYGLFNPFDRPDVDLLPVSDRRYRFYAFPSFDWRGSPDELARAIGQPAPLEFIRFPGAFAAAAALRAPDLKRAEGQISTGRIVADALPGLAAVRWR